MQEYVVVESKEKVLTNDHITDVIVYCGFIITTDSVQCFFIVSGCLGATFFKYCWGKQLVK